MYLLLSALCPLCHLLDFGFTLKIDFSPISHSNSSPSQKLLSYSKKNEISNMTKTLVISLLEDGLCKYLVGYNYLALFYVRARRGLLVSVMPEMACLRHFGNFVTCFPKKNSFIFLEKWWVFEQSARFDNLFNKTAVWRFWSNLMSGKLAGFRNIGFF